MKCVGRSRLGWLIWVCALMSAFAVVRAEGPPAKAGAADAGEGSRQLGQKLLGTGGGGLRFDGPVRIEKDESGSENAFFCVRNGDLEPKGVTILTSSSRSELGVLDPGEKKCSRIDVSGLAGEPTRQLRIEEHGPW